jgi:hypothetical protein
LKEFEFNEKPSTIKSLTKSITNFLAGCVDKKPVGAKFENKKRVLNLKKDNLL